MVVAIIVYKFELNQTEAGDIQPEFNVLVSEFSQENREIPAESLISVNDQFGLYFNSTTGLNLQQRNKGETLKSSFIGRLKETNYKVISHYHQEIDQSQYLIIAFFKLDEEAELFEPMILQMNKKLEAVFAKMMRGNFKDLQFIAEIKGEMRNELKFTVFQIERLSNLTKLQKVALIFASPERIRTLEVLKQGPISRKALTLEIEKIKEHPNIDIIINPFLELNLIRRDWAKGTRDKKGVMRGEGEYLFLVKDVALVRRPPMDAINDAKNTPAIGEPYSKIVEQYYESYDPFKNLVEEGKRLAKYLLDPDMFDFITLLKNKAYPLIKLPKITSEFANSEDLIEKLKADNLIKVVVDAQNREWACLMAEIVPVLVFPEYMLGVIQNRLQSTLQASSSPEKSVPASESVSVGQELTLEVAQKGLDLLETTYGEKIDF